MSPNQFEQAIDEYKACIAKGEQPSDVRPSLFAKYPDIQKQLQNYFDKLDAEDDPNQTPQHEMQDESGLATTDFLSGTVIEDYEIIDFAGKGGMAFVYKARHRSKNRIVALKFMNAVLIAKKGQQTRFMREAQIGAKIKDESIVQVFTEFRHHGLLVIVMEWVEGKTLQEKLNGIPHDPRQVAMFIEIVARAVHTAHCKNVVHRDLKPSNILLEEGDQSHATTPFGRPKITDFGLAKLLDVTQITGSEVLGTPTHMAPEQATGHAHTAGPTADVFSLGVIVYQMLTGQLPFQGTTPQEILDRIVNDDPVPARRVQKKIPRDLETICDKCLQKEPTKRYGSALELAEDLRRFLDNKPILARRIDLLERSLKWVRRHPTTFGLSLATVFTVLLVIGTFQIYHEEQNKKHAKALVFALMNSETAKTPQIIEKLTRYRRWADPLLRQSAENAPAESKEQLHASLALVSTQPDLVNSLIEHMLKATSRDFPVIRDMLVKYRAKVTERLWLLINDNRHLDADSKFRAVCALATFDPSNARLKDFRNLIVSHLINENSVFVGDWCEGFRPVKHQLLEPLAQVYRDKSKPKRELLRASELLADFADDQPHYIVKLLTEANPEQYAALLPTLDRYPQTAITLLRKELKRTPLPEWNDLPANPEWKIADPKYHRVFEDYHGKLHDRFAFCQTMPLNQFISLADALKHSGYCPIRFRPYRKGNVVQVGAVWERSNREWKIRYNVSASILRQYDAQLQKKGYIPLDVASYVQPRGNRPSEQRYAAVWAKMAHGKDEFQLAIGIRQGEERQVLWALSQSGYRRMTFHTGIGKDGKRCHCSVLRRLAKDHPGYQSSIAFNDAQITLKRKLSPKNVYLDISVFKPVLYPNKRERLSNQLSLLNNPDNPTALLQRARACLGLGKLTEAVKGLSTLINENKAWDAPFMYRAIAYARLGNAEQANKDLANFEKVSSSVSRKAFLRAVLSVYLLPDQPALQQLERTIAVHLKDPEVLYDAARAYAVASQVAANNQPTKAKSYSDRAATLLQASFKTGYANYSTLLDDQDFESLLSHPEIIKLLRAVDLQWQYSFIWHPRKNRESTVVYGLEPTKQQERCADLAKLGYRPASVAVTWNKDLQTFITASIWHRPLESDIVKDAVASKRSNAAIALLHLGDEKEIWPLLRHSSDPRLRTFIIHSFAKLGCTIETLLKRFSHETDTSSRRAIILALGGFSTKQLAPKQQEDFQKNLCHMYRNDPDPGMHSAIDWLLRQRWKAGNQLDKDDSDLAKNPVGPQRWCVNRHGHTLAKIHGPVEFLMGSPHSEVDRDDTEALHRRRIPRSFAIATKEVTIAQFKRFLKAKPNVDHVFSEKYSPDQRGPIISVTWFQAAQYCRWLSEQENVPKDQMCYPPVHEIKPGMKLPQDFLERTGYRLPTAAEWEYACRAKAETSRAYGESSELLKNFAWYNQNANDRAWPAGNLWPNDFGLFDMHGNVWELCHDPNFHYPIFGRNLQPVADYVNETQINSSPRRIIRGGAFVDSAPTIRSAVRTAIYPTDTFYAIGFRIAKTTR